MLLGEPAPSQADLHFRMFGIPVRVHPFFWLVTLFLGMGGGEAEPVRVLVWVAVVFVSILVHELGHAFAQRYYGGRPRIVLYSLGGLAVCPDCDRRPRSQINISLAGPAAGFLLAILTLVFIRATGRHVGFTAGGSELDFRGLGIESAIMQPMAFFNVYFQPFAAPLANQVVADLLYVNILWGIVNLLPIYPLDGGHVARELLTLGNPRRGIIQSLQLSIGAAALVAIYALSQSSIYVCLMFGLLAYDNFQALRAYQSHWS